jgi:hypothetical protein
MAENESTKVCPHCAETIKAAAKVCPFCQNIQNFWRNLVGDAARTIYAMGLAILCFGTAVYLLVSERNFSDYHEQVVVLDTRMAEEVTNENTNVIVFGTLTNRSAYAWDRVGFEVRFFDKGGTLTAVNSTVASENFTLLPHSEHAFRLTLYNRKLNPLYVSAKAYVHGAKDSKAW